MTDNALSSEGRPNLAPPASEIGAFGWARRNLFSSWGNGLTTVVLVFLVGWMLASFFQWAVIDAIWSGPDGTVCRGHGACWAIIHEKYRYIFFGSFPYEEQWRPLCAVVAMLAMLIASADRRMWNKRLISIWAVGSFVALMLMFGEFDIGASLIFGAMLAVGALASVVRTNTGTPAEINAWRALAAVGLAGLVLRIVGVLPGFSIPIHALSYVETGKWGGLPVTIILATYGLVFAFPLGILLALGRPSNLPLIKGLCVGFIELIRGVPLISLLIMASVMLPLFLPQGTTIDKFLRALVAVTIFAAAYIAEIIRGGLQSLPKGQFEAADAMAFSYPQKTLLIILPQALRVVIPPLINTFIGFFKDTSLVLIIGIFDFLNTAKAALVDPKWAGFPSEVYLFAAFVYFCFCFSMSRYSKYLEIELNKGTRR
jgi:general L-amino acid transport system permease protein